MTRAEDLLKALVGLQKAADNELSGEAHSVASQNIKGLFRLAGFDGGDAGEGGNEPAPAFAEALSDVREQAEGELAGNAFYLASKALDDLASLSLHPASPAMEPMPEPLEEPVPAEHASPVSFAGAASPAAAEVEAAPPGASFDELAAASKARVEEAAASLGAEIVHHYAPVLDDQHETQEYDDPLAAVEFEKLSSEPWSMPEIEVISPEPVLAQQDAPVSFTGAASPAAAEVEAAPVASFDELAAASKARVEEAAESLGSEIVHHDEPVLDDRYEAHEHDDPLVGMEFEKRSSEPCCMPEIEPVQDEPAPAPAAAPLGVEIIEAGSAREVAEAAHDFGSPAMQAEPMAEYAARHEGYGRQSDASVQSEPEAQASPAAHESSQEAEPVYDYVEAAGRVMEHPVSAAPEAAPPMSAPQMPAEAAPVAPAPKPAAEAPSPVREVPPVTIIKKVETAPKEVEKHAEKTFFSLWLDMVFGRKK